MTDDKQKITVQQKDNKPKKEGKVIISGGHAEILAEKAKKKGK